MVETTTDFVISEEIIEHIESQLKNKHCKKCPYEGAGINSGILSYLRKVPLEAELQKERERVRNIVEDIERVACTCMWSDAPDCPGQSQGECNCDGCERYEFISDEDLRNYIHEKAESLRNGVEK